MANPRVHEVAAELGIDSKIALAKLKDMGEFIKSASSSIPPPLARRLKYTLERDLGLPGVDQPEPSDRFVVTGVLAARLIGAMSNLPRSMPSFVDLLELAVRGHAGGANQTFRVVPEVVKAKSFYFCPDSFQGSAESIAAKALPSEHGMAVVRREEGIEVIAWTTRQTLVVHRCLLRRVDKTVVGTRTSNASRQLEDGVYYVNEGRGAGPGVSRLAQLIESIPVDPPSTTSPRVTAESPGIRLMRVDNQDGRVHLVYLRRRTEAGRVESAREAVHRNSRWTVRGHWRNQYYPSVAGHRRLWIAEHVAGAADSPARKPDIVYVIKPVQSALP